MWFQLTWIGRHYTRQRATLQLWSHLLPRCTFIMEYRGIRSFTPRWQARFITHAPFEMLIRISEPCFKSRTVLRASALVRRRSRRGNTRRVSKAAALAATNDSPAAGTKINYLWIILRTHIIPPLHLLFKRRTTHVRACGSLTATHEFYFGKVSRLLLFLRHIKSF